MSNHAPPEIEQLLGLIGENATLRLVELHGGTRVYVPDGLRKANHLARDLGEEAAQLLAAEFGRDYLRVPMVKAWRARIYHARGESYRAIALKLGCNESTVFQYVRARAPSLRLGLPFAEARLRPKG